MDDYQSERPAKPRRPARRSMAELAASLESGTVVEKLPSQQAIINGQTNVAQGAAERVPQSNNHNGSGLEDERTLQQLDEVTLAAAKCGREAPYCGDRVQRIKEGKIAGTCGTQQGWRDSRSWPTRKQGRGHCHQRSGVRDAPPPRSAIGAE